MYNKRNIDIVKMKNDIKLLKIEKSAVTDFKKADGSLPAVINLPANFCETEFS